MSPPSKRRTQILPAHNVGQYAIARTLFVEYGNELGHDLSFQRFAHELDSLPGAYAPPAGCLLLATVDDAWAGCVALRPGAATNAACEMKRLYVRLTYRGQGLGRRLAAEVIRRARAVGYACMRLDTLRGMTVARTLYASLGFRETPPYYHNPMGDAVFYELDLTSA